MPFYVNIIWSLDDLRVGVCLYPTLPFLTYNNSMATVDLLVINLVLVLHFWIVRNVLEGIRGDIEIVQELAPFVVNAIFLNVTGAIAMHTSWYLR